MKIWSESVAQARLRHASYKAQRARKDAQLGHSAHVATRHDALVKKCERELELAIQWA